MQTGKANYRLAARLRGNELLLDADLRKAVEEEHLRAVRRAEGLKCCADRRAFAESVEWERLGDFFLRVGSRPSAVRAYRDAALACLDGDYYDHGTEMLPCRFLRLRFLRMAETAAIGGFGYAFGQPQVQHQVFGFAAVRNLPILRIFRQRSRARQKSSQVARIEKAAAFHILFSGDSIIL